MCHLVGAALLTASMALCYLFSLVSEGACPVLYTKESGRSPVVWLIVFSTMLSLVGCFAWCLFAPEQRHHREGVKDDAGSRVRLVAAVPHD